MWLTAVCLATVPLGTLSILAVAAIGAVREGAYKTVSQAPGYTGR